MLAESSYITESKWRCRHAGRRPETIPDPKDRLSAKERMQRLSAYSKVYSQVEKISSQQLELIRDTHLAFAVIDDNGYVLELSGDCNVLQLLRRKGVVAGIPLTERGVGTNAVSLSLERQKPIQLIGEEHFWEGLQSMASYAVPFSYEKPSELCGALAILAPLEYHSPYLLLLLSNMVEQIRKELELDVKNQQLDRFHNLMTHTVRNGIILTDKYGRIKELNPFMEKIICRSREQLLEQSVFQLEPFGHYVETVLRTGQMIADQEIVFHDDMMQTTVCLFDAQPIYDDERKQIQGTYLQFRDITDRHELERQILLSEKFSAIGKLAAGLAHEIRNPLTSIIGFVYLMKQTVSQPPEKRYLDIIDQELMTLNKLVSQFVLMAKPSNPQIRTCNLNSLITDTIVLMQSQAILKNITLETRLPEEALEVRIDAQQIKQVLVNLIQNAIEAMNQRGVIRIVLHRNKSYAVIRIIDEGEGISDEHLKHILTPFYTTKEEGLGLGLSISYRMVESHKGKMDIYSKPGVGTTFTIQLPTMEEEGKH